MQNKTARSPRRDAPSSRGSLGSKGDVSVFDVRLEALRVHLEERIALEQQSRLECERWMEQRIIAVQSDVVEPLCLLSKLQERVENLHTTVEDRLVQHDQHNVEMFQSRLASVQKHLVGEACAEAYGKVANDLFVLSQMVEAACAHMGQYAERLQSDERRTQGSQSTHDVLHCLKDVSKLFASDAAPNKEDDRDTTKDSDLELSLAKALVEAVGPESPADTDLTNLVPASLSVPIKSSQSEFTVQGRKTDRMDQIDKEAKSTIARLPVRILQSPASGEWQESIGFPELCEMVEELVAASLQSAHDALEREAHMRSEQDQHVETTCEQIEKMCISRLSSTERAIANLANELEAQASGLDELRVSLNVEREDRFSKQRSLSEQLDKLRNAIIKPKAGILRSPSSPSPSDLLWELDGEDMSTNALSHRSRSTETSPKRALKSASRSPSISVSFPTTTQSVDQMFTLTSEENSEIGSAKQTEILGSLKDLRMEVTIFKDVEPDRQESQGNVVARKDSLQFEPSPSPTLLDRAQRSPKAAKPRSVRSSASSVCGNQTLQRQASVPLDVLTVASRVGVTSPVAVCLSNCRPFVEGGESSAVPEVERRSGVTILTTSEPNPLMGHWQSSSSGCVHDDVPRPKLPSAICEAGNIRHLQGLGSVSGGVDRRVVCAKASPPMSCRQTHPVDGRRHSLGSPRQTSARSPRRVNFTMGECPPNQTGSFQCRI